MEGIVRAVHGLSRYPLRKRVFSTFDTVSVSRTHQPTLEYIDTACSLLTFSCHVRDWVSPSDMYFHDEVWWNIQAIAFHRKSRRHLESWSVSAFIYRMSGCLMRRWFPLDYHVDGRRVLLLPIARSHLQIFVVSARTHSSDIQLVFHTWVLGPLSSYCHQRCHNGPWSRACSQICFVGRIPFGSECLLITLAPLPAEHFHRRPFQKDLACTVPLDCKCAAR